MVHRNLKVNLLSTEVALEMSTRASGNLGKISLEVSILGEAFTGSGLETWGISSGGISSGTSEVSALNLQVMILSTFFKSFL